MIQPETIMGSLLPMYEFEEKEEEVMELPVVEEVKEKRSRMKRDQTAAINTSTIGKLQKGKSFSKQISQFNQIIPAISEN